MPDTSPTPVEIVRGEIQPWTDYEGTRQPASGPVLRALLDDLLPARAARTLVAGPHGRDVVALAVARSEHVTVLLRSVSDAVALHEWLTSQPEAGRVTVVTGALDGLADAKPDPFDVVLAADGLDRLLGADSPALDWPARAGLLRGLGGPQALLLVSVENEFALTALYDRRPVDARHGDDEWRPLHDDPQRPTSPAQVGTAFTGAGYDVRQQYALFDEDGVAHTLLDVTAAAGTRPGRPGARLAIRGLAAAGAHTPLLGPVADGADAAARAGLLDAVAPGWLVVAGPGGQGRTAYTNAGGVLGLDLSGGAWDVTVLDTDGPALFDAALVAKRVPDTESVEQRLFRLAAAEDVPGFRALAAKLGAWAGDEAALLLDDLHLDGETFARGPSGWRTGGAGKDELLAAAWTRFRDRLIGAHRRHPWPPWMVDSDDLVKTWLGMSGVEATDDLAAKGRELADRLALAADVEAEQPDFRTELADAEAARLKAKELAGHVFGLERTLRFRDQALRTREQQVRSVRDTMRELKNSRAMQLTMVLRKAGVVRDPKRLARAVKRRLRGG